jgi:signal transduction histidine kinase
MKNSAFLLRVLICFALSLVPTTELENRIYSERLQLRGKWPRSPDVAILDLGWSDQSAKALKIIEAGLTQLGAKAVYTVPPPAGELVVDTDGVVRRAVMQTKSGPALTWKVYLRFHPEVPSARVPIEPHLINYLGPTGTVPRCKVGDTLKGLAKPCADLKGKIVLLDSSPDYIPPVRTPVGDMSYAEVLGNDLHTVVLHHPIYRASFVEVALIILAMILIGAFYIIYYQVVVSAVAVTATGLAVLLVLFQGVFFLFDIYIPSANIGAAVLITYLVFTGYRLEFLENLQWRSLKQAQYLRELDEMKSNFLSLVSHDLKTPLAKIQALVERLRREISGESAKHPEWGELVDSIENSNNELKHYINSILNLSRIESQKVILKKKSNDINQLIQQALKRLRPLAQQKTIQIEENLETLFSIECDEELMRQVLTNLIDNAIKYSPPSSKVIVRSREEEGFVRVEVEDFGPGIPKDQLPLMFRKFSRFLRPMKENVKGTGLGLYLSKYFIELHGGTIRVESIEGKGTTFTFTLPLHGVESDPALG